MLEPPDLAEDVMLAAVGAGYGIPVTDLTFLPIGLDSSAWVYRAQAVDGAAYFLKVRRGIANPSSLLVPRFLRDHGVTQVVAPIPTSAHTLWVDVGEFALILYPFIEGTTGTDHGMSEQHWVAYGAVLRQIHATVPAPELAQGMRRETFVPGWSDVVKQIDAAIASRRFTSPSERDLAVFWRARREEIRTLVDRAETLGRRLRAADLPLVLCHADIHTWNLLIDVEDRLWVVDWDETVLAPKERDLMFAVGGLARTLVGPRAEAWFLAGYGETTIDPLALAYYRYARAVEDLGAFAEDVFLSAETGEPTKRASV
ncbi:MAG: phosphotransferase enzyme family protein, partial [Dehalococcoidia bacterium]